MEYCLLLVRNGIKETRVEPFLIEGMNRGLMTLDGSGQMDELMVNKKWMVACRLKNARAAVEISKMAENISSDGMFQTFTAVIEVES